MYFHRLSGLEKRIKNRIRATYNSKALNIKFDINNYVNNQTYRNCLIRLFTSNTMLSHVCVPYDMNIV